MYMESLFQILASEDVLFVGTDYLHVMDLMNASSWWSDFPKSECLRNLISVLRTCCIYIGTFVTSPIRT